ncbi:hypothetical protein CH298_05945 [Rhodococcoides fascians]|jgi:4-hydroxybenzoate polyprenyltransferase|uniref:hypothetical protein n=1 Tax=Nocardiaceae TaxID=85025 RepID=UPI000B9B4718|nr:MULTISPECIES: hypothetical protein [Rhodococcus]OZC58610.1 hypothetical protein CH267_07125 [Rhodococcus sp. 06-621-2]OZD68217.1 hypothetical protein CH268_00215 [Rhodococcus sp. 06-1460-1B]OZE33492.1 hypothetical protein CH278_12740 [Rhodococcus sp. 05-2254-5]OZE51010.1 hypothetical protein CH269_25685 [Rhodococcus sp. 05-2254-1]OZE91912.1 hypothetical protein CH303_05940 [Rhodococcus fascians]
MILHSLHTGIDILAQIELTPEAPPKSDGFLRLGRWLLWFVVLAGVCALVYGGGKFGWEKYNGGSLESPKIVVGALIGGVIATSAGTIMNTVVLS